MPATATFDQLVCIAVMGLAGIYAARIAAGLMLWLFAGLPGRAGIAFRAASARVTPRLVRRLVSSALGAAVLGGSVSMSAGMAAAAQVDRDATSPVSDVIDMGRPEPTGMRGRQIAESLPGLDRGAGHVGLARDVARPTNRPRERTLRLRGSETEVMVKPGECLWTIAADHLGRRASNSDIDREWRRWYRLNRQRIGPDPDVVRVGTMLRVPA